MADVEGIRFGLMTNLFPSWTRGGKRCIRSGSKDGQRVVLPNVVQLIPPADRSWQWAHVFFVRLSPETHAKWNKQPEYYYVVALHAPQVESYLQKRYTAIASKYMGMAQVAITTAQQQVSTRAVRGPTRLGSKARRTAEKNLRVRSFGGVTEWTVAIDDDLDYAAQAFKRSDAVDVACAKAANSIAGMLRKRAGDLLDPSLATPFPELKKVRRTA